EALVVLDARDEPLLLEEAYEALSHRIDARLVVAAAVDIHGLTEQRQHRLLLRGQPVGNGRFLRCRLGHRALALALGGVQLLPMLCSRHSKRKRCDRLVRTPSGLPPGLQDLAGCFTPAHVFSTPSAVRNRWPMAAPSF